MKLPEYSLAKEVSLKDIEFPAGTLVSTVFWSEHNLPVHIRDELHEYIKFLPEKEQYLMCIIGQQWIPIHRKYIRKSR